METILFIVCCAALAFVVSGGLHDIITNGWKR
jgi:hypothetical protein